MRKLNWKVLFNRQGKLVGLKEELSKGSSWIIISKLSYSLAQTLFFIDNNYHKRFLDDVLDKKAKMGSWRKSYHLFSRTENKHIREAKVNSY